MFREPFVGRSSRQHEAHGPLISSAILAEVPLAGLSLPDPKPTLRRMHDARLASALGLAAKQRGHTKAVVRRICWERGIQQIGAGRQQIGMADKLIGAAPRRRRAPANARPAARDGPLRRDLSYRREGRRLDRGRGPQPPAGLRRVKNHCRRRRPPACWGRDPGARARRVIGRRRRRARRGYSARPSRQALQRGWEEPRTDRRARGQGLPR